MGDGSIDLRIEEEKHETVLLGERSCKTSAAVYLNMHSKSETADDGHEMYLTRDQATQLRDWLNAQITV